MPVLKLTEAHAEFTAVTLNVGSPRVVVVQRVCTSVGSLAQITLMQNPTSVDTSHQKRP